MTEGYKSYRFKWRDMTHEERVSEIARMASTYRDMKILSLSMYNEVMWQYKDMAQGGGGGPLGFTPDAEGMKRLVDSYQPVGEEITIRAYNYPDYPDSFFQGVLDTLGEV